jgi:hypothetical protein
MKIRIKVPTIANIDDRAESLVPGSVMELKKADAESLIAAGYAEEFEEPEYERAVHPVSRKRSKG